MQHQRAGKKKCNPKKARAVTSRFLRRGLKREAEEHYDDQA